MLENTHFEGGAPNRELVYELRRRALEGIDLPGLLALIAERLAIPPGHGGWINIVAYLGMAFDVSIRAGKVLAHRVEHTGDGYIITEPDAGDAVVAQIEANRERWSQNLHPGPP